MSDTRTNTALPRELHDRLKMAVSLPLLKKKHPQIRQVTEEAVTQWLDKKRPLIAKHYPAFMTLIFPDHATSSKQ